MKKEKKPNALSGWLSGCTKPLCSRSTCLTHRVPELVSPNIDSTSRSSVQPETNFGNPTGHGTLKVFEARGPSLEHADDRISTIRALSMCTVLKRTNLILRGWSHRAVMIQHTTGIYRHAKPTKQSNICEIDPDFTLFHYTAFCQCPKLH